MEYSSMKECDATFKPTQISPQNPHHQLPKVHKKKIHQNNFQTHEKAHIKKGKSWTCEGQEEQCDWIRVPITEGKKPKKL